MHYHNAHTPEELLAGLRQGDTIAFTEIYKRYWKKVYAVAYNRVAESGLAEDIAQEVFASLWANRQAVQIEKLENYLATAAKYLVLTAIRKKELQRSYGGHVAKTTSISITPETSYQNRQILQLLEIEIEKLPEKCKLIFKSSREEGKAVKRIAEELNLSPKTVENQIYKAVKLLKLASRSFFSFLLFQLF